MLVLSRSPGQSIIIDDHYLTIKIIGFDNGKVRVGLKAAKEVKIYREEIYELVQNPIDKESNTKN